MTLQAGGGRSEGHSNGAQGQPRHVWGPVQNENAGPLFEKQEKGFFLSFAVSPPAVMFLLAI